MTLGLLLSGGLGFEVLKRIEKEYTICFVLTDSNSKEIIAFCEQCSIPLFKGNPRGGKAYNFIENIPVDVIASINYLFLINEDVISHSKHLTFNIHGSLLPKYRGRTPHVWAIINNEDVAGITAHEVDSGCDTGRIIKQIEIPIEKTDSGADILEKYKQNYYPLIKAVLINLKNGNLVFTKQIEEQATYFGKRTPDDGKINWNWQKERIYNWVRAQRLPYPGAFSYYNKEKLIIDEIVFSDLGFDYSDENGKVLANSPSLFIKTPNGVIEVKKERNGIKVPVGYVLKY